MVYLRAVSVISNVYDSSCEIRRLIARDWVNNYYNCDLCIV